MYFEIQLCDVPVFHLYKLHVYMWTQLFLSTEIPLLVIIFVGTETGEFERITYDRKEQITT